MYANVSNEMILRPLMMQFVHGGQKEILTIRQLVFGVPLCFLFSMYPFYRSGGLLRINRLCLSLFFFDRKYQNSATVRAHSNSEH